jgi:hypothetical protein
MYQLYNSIYNLQIIYNLSDNVWIPLDPDNTDYQAYLEWLEAGNEPDVIEVNE